MTIAWILKIHFENGYTYQKSRSRFLKIGDNMEKRRFILALDFDETIATNAFPDIQKAELNPPVLDNLERMKNILTQRGISPIVILWTCRTDNDKGLFLTDAVEFCEKHGIHIDYVNENPLVEFDMFKEVDIYTPSPKIHYDFLLDDKTSSALFPGETVEKFKMVLDRMEKFL